MIKEKRIKNDLSDELINEWHPTKNKNLTPYDVSRGSGKIVWWECSKNHEWQARVGDRSKGKGCPYCSNRKVQKGFNDLTTTHPHLASEWHPTKNKDITPDSVSYGSDKKVWWLCKKGHEWEATIGYRSNGGRCPHCSKEKMLKRINDLATTHPELVKEWHPTKNKDLTPNNVTRGSNKKIWWLCSHCNKEYERLVFSQVKIKRCPNCRAFIE